MVLLEYIGFLTCVVGGMGFIAGAVWLIYTVIDTAANLDAETKRRVAEDEGLNERVKALEKKA